jgi:hypothetical protein
MDDMEKRLSELDGIRTGDVWDTRSTGAGMTMRQPREEDEVATRSLGALAWRASRTRTFG